MKSRQYSLKWTLLKLTRKVSSMRRSKYSEEFKKQAVKQVLESDSSIKEDY